MVFNLNSNTILSTIFNKILLSFFFVAASRNRPASKVSHATRVILHGNNFGINIIVIILLRDRCNYDVRHTMTKKSDFFSHIHVTINFASFSSVFKTFFSPFIVLTLCSHDPKENISNILNKLQLLS